MWAYFDCTAAPDDSCADHAHGLVLASSSLESPTQLRGGGLDGPGDLGDPAAPGGPDTAEKHKNSAGWSPFMGAHEVKILTEWRGACDRCPVTG
jgi:hypothetical protein